MEAVTDSRKIGGQVKKVSVSLISITDLLKDEKTKKETDRQTSATSLNNVPCNV